jgi:endogenous inhibitor of DNA gyrase (YacG/DUF329 family)
MKLAPKSPKNSATGSSLKVTCPSCGVLAAYSQENLHRPFCSDRCKVGDLAAWASDVYAVPVCNTSSEEDENLAADFTEKTEQN